MKVFMYDLRTFDELKYCEQYSQETNIDFDYSSSYPSLENAYLAKGFDSISTTPCTISAELIECFHSLGVKHIACRSIGYDHVDLEKATECDIHVSNVSYPPDAVANYSIMLMMMSLRKMSHIMKRSELQDFSLKGKIGKDISNCTIGIIGTGNIGTTVIRNLSNFGCSIYAYDMYQNETVSKYATYTDLNTLFQNSDIISLHINATEENHYLIDEDSLKQMKETSIIINTARGSLIDTKALIHALEQNKIGGAALDVLENEEGLYYHNQMGNVISNPDFAILRSFPNVILSPHTAFYTEESVANMVRGAFDSLYAIEHGLNIPHAISP